MTEPARSFQHYEVLRREDGTLWELGRGAMGVTYKAFDVNLCCEVALKVVNAALVEHPEARERFVREARAAAALRHRNVASVYHLGNDGEHFFYAMEFINGDTLDARVRQSGPLSVEDTLRVVLQVARALAAAARQNLVHRDIKPANLMVTHEDADEETVVKVIDFGLARPAANTADAPPLTIGGFVGTPQYASPEQLEEHPLDARSDLYSLGVTAWFLLTGRVPFTGSLATICQQQLTHPPPWEQLPVAVPTCVRGLLGHLLAKDPARRPQTAAELRAEIETCLEKVQGTERKRDLHLPPLPAAPAAPRETPPKAAPRQWQAGTLLTRRYRLLREIGGRDGVRVYQARDELDGEQPVAVKILPETVSTLSPEHGELSEQVRLVQAAAHPRLVQIKALARCPAPAAMFLVEEWLAGFTVRDLLAGRGGALPLAEALPLLEQAASAVDHAATCRLQPLVLAVTELHLSFPALTAARDDDSQGRALLSKRMAEWPDWTLKIHAFRMDRDPLALDTWAGGVTLIPATGRGGQMSTDTGEAAGGQAARSLATLAYELLGGPPVAPHFTADAPPMRYTALPVLNEDANEVLRQALSGESTFLHGWQWHEALVAAVGGEPARGAFPCPVGPVALALPAEAKELPAAHPQSSALQDSPSLSQTVTEEPGTRMAAGGESVAEFFGTGQGLELDDAGESGAGSAWDRLTLVTGKRSHPGRWLAGIMGLAAVFVLVFVGVLAWLLQQTPARAAATPPVTKRPAEPVPAAPAHVRTRQGTPSPLPTVLASRRENTPTPAGTPGAPTEAIPAPSPTAVARVENIPPLPSAAESPAVSVLVPLKERLMVVRLDSVPPGAQIRLGNEVLGVTPCRVRLPPGDHQLIARYQDWPETRHTIHLDGTEARPAVEIRLMRPDLVPGLAVPSPALTEGHTRRIAAPAAHHSPVAEATVLPPRATPVWPTVATPNPSEPEVRPAQRVLTPFKLDEPAPASETPAPAPANRQPFSADDDNG